MCSMSAGDASAIQSCLQSRYAVHWKVQAAPGESHFLGVKQVVQTLLYNVQLDIAFLQLLQQVQDL